MKKLVKESLNDYESNNEMDDYRANKLTFPAEYPGIRNTAKQLEKKLGIILEEIGPDEGDEMSLDDDDRELACIHFLVSNKMIKQIEDEEFVIVIDSMKRFQFFFGGEPISTIKHNAAEKREMWQSINPAFISVDLLTPVVYAKVAQKYRSHNQ